MNVFGRLDILDLSNTQINFKFIKKITTSKDYSNLKKIYLKNCKQLDDKAVSCFYAKEFQKWVFLDLSYNPQINL